MKKFFVMLTVALAATALFVSCDDDDDKKDNLGKAVAGSYDVNCDVKIGEAPSAAYDAKIVFTRINDTNAKVNLNDLTIDQVGAVTVEVASIKLGGKPAGVTIDYTGNLSVSIAGGNPVELPGTIKGTIAPEATTTDVVKLNVTVDASSLEMGTITIVVTDAAATPQ